MNTYAFLYILLHAFIVLVTASRSLYLYKHFEAVKTVDVRNVSRHQRLYKAKMACMGSLLSLAITFLMEIVTLWLLWMAGLFTK